MSRKLGSNNDSPNTMLQNGLGLLNALQNTLDDAIIHSTSAITVELATISLV